MRGYLTRPGLGLLVGILALSLGAAGWLDVGGACHRVAGLDSAQQIGPFQVAVERCEVVRDGDRYQAVVQMHLWRPDGPVDLARRIPIDGQGWLDNAWLPTDTEWLIKNEFVRIPPSDILLHPVLGKVPATVHAGEARGIFTFEWTCPATEPASAANFTFSLPDGRDGTFRLPMRVR